MRPTDTTIKLKYEGIAISMNPRPPKKGVGSFPYINPNRSKIIGAYASVKKAAMGSRRYNFDSTQVNFASVFKKFLP
jgi:hypothetical protein